MATNMRIGEYMVKNNFLTRDQVESAFVLSKDKGIKIGQAIISMYPEQEQNTYAYLSEQLSMPLMVDPKIDDKFETEVLSYISKDKLKALRVYPINKEITSYGIVVNFVSEDICNEIIDLVKMKHPQYRVNVHLAVPSFFNTKFGGGGDYVEIVATESSKDYDNAWEIFNEMDARDESAVRANIKKIIIAAQKKGTSDIHISPEANRTAVKFRIDGVLIEEKSFPSKDIAKKFASVIMNQAGLEQSDFINPQDGSIKVPMGDKEINLRISVLPSLNGPNTVIRILDASNAPLNLEALKLSEYNLSSIINMITRSQGIILITGPTGSGKSTTLYSAITRMNTGDTNIITIEDPVERPLNGIVQVQINPKSKVNYATVLKSCLRQDPDVILVGEIRDKETAVISVQAANTGHLVMSTLHTNSAVSTITRFIDMGVQSFQVADSLIGVVNQRLARKVCNNCAIEKTLNDENLCKTLGVEVGLKYKEGTGCKLCNKGYKGRVGIHEVLLIDDPIRKALNDGKLLDLEKLAHESGMRTLIMDGVEKIRQGITTPIEIARHAKAH